MAPSRDAAAAADVRAVTGPAAAAAHVRIRLFAAYRDAAGRAELSLPVGGADGATTVGDIWRRLVADHPALAALPPAAAVNAVLARFDAPVAAGDEVAFLPPVSGG